MQIGPSYHISGPILNAFFISWSKSVSHMLWLSKLSSLLPCVEHTKSEEKVPAFYQDYAEQLIPGQFQVYFLLGTLQFSIPKQFQIFHRF